MNVLIADKFEAHGQEALRQAGFDVTCDPHLGGYDLVDAIKGIEPDVLVVRSTRVTSDMLHAGAKLKLVIRAGSGFDTIDVAAATDRCIRVCNCPGKNSVAVAELTMGLMIALDRRIVDETDDLRRGVWNKKEYSKARGLMGRTLGIVGLGRIGFEVAVRARAFGMRLIYSDVIEHPEMERELGLSRVTMERLLEEADFLTLHVPGGSDTHHMIGRRELERMKPTAFVINCSRGGVVDEAALADAVRNGMIAGAALDVFEIEPAATEAAFSDPIRAVPHVYGTHHVGASTDQAQEAVADEVVKIIRTFKETGKFLNCVNTDDAVMA